MAHGSAFQQQLSLQDQRGQCGYLSRWIESFNIERGSSKNLDLIEIGQRRFTLSLDPLVAVNNFVHFDK